MHAQTCSLGSPDSGHLYLVMHGVLLPSVDVPRLMHNCRVPIRNDTSHRRRFIPGSGLSSVVPLGTGAAA